ncbi:MAG: hypothetical protein IJ410_06315 [Oscillospiraceae bacterium]|nr:hypothetical protein [Oscillospiraceae bacterium]
MKKFVKITALTALMIMAMAFTACDTTQQRSSSPKVEIVERSDLLNRIDMSYIIPREKVRRLSNRGLNVTFKHFMLTSDTQASFDLILENKEGIKLTLPVQAMLDYDHTVENGRDVFSDIQLYWGDVDLYGDSIIVTNMSQPIRFSLTDMEMKWEKYDTSFADGGYIVDSIQTGDNMAFLYYTENDEGIAVFDSNSQLVSRTSFVKTGDSSNLADVHGDVFVPARLQSDAHIYDVGGILYAKGDNRSHMFDYNRGRLYTLSGTPWQTVETEDTIYTIHRFENYTGGKSAIYMAMAEKGGQITDMQTFSMPVSPVNLAVTSVVNGNGQPVLEFADIGMMITIDFAGDRAYTQFTITDEMLTEKLYTSPDKAYELYSYAHYDSTVPAYHIALKETATGAIRYIGEIGMINGYYEGETGFVDDSIYLLTGENLRIFDTDMSSTTHTFALADYFRLGNIGDGYDTRHLVSSTSTENGGVAVVYYEDNLMAADEDRFADMQSKTTLKSVYKVAVFDFEGNMTASYDTGMNVICGWCPVHSYIKGGEINISVEYKDTDHIFTKGTLNLTDGAFTLVKEYTAPDKW